MRNLRVTSALISQGSIDEDVEGFADDFFTGAAFVATRSKLLFYNKELEQCGSLGWEDERSGMKLVDLTFMSDTNDVIAIFNNGLVYTASAETMQPVDEPGLLGCAVQAASWSPDGDTLVVVSGDMICFFDRLLTAVSERPLYGEAVGKDELVTVGWGSKETQFQGAAGKVAREKRTVNRKALPDDSGRPSISWRADAQHATISYLDVPTEERRVAVYSREGELMSRLRNEFPLEEGVAVKPVGNYIATTKRLDDGSRYFAFFERNGEPRHEAKIHEANVTRRHFAWEFEGNILAVEVDDGEKSYLELWTVSNYEWSQKLRIPFEKGLDAWHWSAVTARRLWACSGGRVYRYDLIFEYNVSGGLAVVVATDKLKVTDFSKAPIPPPMSHFTVPIHRGIQLLVCSFGYMSVVYDDFSIECWSAQNGRFESHFCTPAAGLETNRAEALTAGIHSADGALYLAGPSKIGSLVHRVYPDQGTEILLEFPRNIIETSINPSDGRPIVMLDDGSVISLENEKLYSLPECLSCRNASCGDKLISLSPAHILYSDGKLLFHDISSFVIRDNLLICVTMDSKLRIYDGASGYRQVDKERALELGSCLVAAVPEPGTSLVLQMPRGNLETIHPRIFVVAGIRTQLTDRRYLQALKAMKKHRIDMNLLFDQNPQKFFADARYLIETVNDPDLLNLFVAALNDAPSEWSESRLVYPNKVQVVCEALSEAFKQLPEERRRSLLTVLLSVLLKTDPPSIKEALRHVRENSLAVSPEDREKTTRYWLHHVGFFVESKALFSAALSTYDLPLTVQVAEASNADPKQFLPLLNRLRKDWDGALKHIAGLDQHFEEAVQLIKQKGIYASAMRTFVATGKYREICAIYAEFLETKAQWAEAALIYANAGRLQDQTRCLEKAREPTEYYRVAKLVGRSEDDIKTVLRKMSALLKSTASWEKLVECLELTDSSVSTICEALVEAGRWEEALDKALVDEKAFQSTRVRLLDRAELLRGKADTQRAEVEKHAERLKIVRTIKERRLVNLKEGLETGRDLEDIDAFSEASTASGVSRRSGSSRASTTATARKRKTIEKKKRNLKEGGEWEDAAILLAAHEIYSSMELMTREASLILRPLVRISALDEALATQTSISELEAKCQSLLHVFWPQRLHPHHLVGPLHHLYTIDNVLNIPEDGGMPASFVLEPEMCPPKLPIGSWKLPMLSNPKL
ncbi:unnamed protein product, partial [Mesorhabditis spiculigera]